MKKTFILDTNVLLHDAGSLLVFEENEVVLPITVLEELDTFKKRQDEVGRNARAVSRILDSLRKDASLTDGVPTEDGGTIRIEIMHQEAGNLPPGFNSATNDGRILGCSLALKGASERVILVSKDINMRVKADALGIEAADYQAETVSIDDLYSGTRVIEVPSGVVDAFYASKVFSPPEETALLPNQFVTLADEASPSHTALGRFIDKDKSVRPLKHSERTVSGIKALNREQRFAFEILLDDNVLLVSLVGIAGTGKTLIALAAGLEKVVNEDKYQRLLVSRPIVPMGKDLGYLPGDVEEKLLPRMQPISDNLEFLFSAKAAGGKPGGTLEDLVEDGIIELEPLTYIRGRSIPNQFIVVDEAQNLTPLELKTIITRVGEGSKIVLTGDPYQIDHPYLDSESNGLAHVVERFKGSSIFGHVTLTKGERSVLAETAARLM